MVKYIATFPDGAQITRRTSGRRYSHCWRVIWDVTESKVAGLPDRTGHSCTGFARTPELAQSAMQTFVNGLRRARNYKAANIRAELAPAVAQ